MKRWMVALAMISGAFLNGNVNTLAASSKEVEEAARIEGANLWQIFWMIALPLSLDGLIVTAVIVFSFSWNEALFASALTSQDAATLPSFILASRSTFRVSSRTASSLSFFTELASTSSSR